MMFSFPLPSSDQRLKEKIEVLCYRLDSSHSNAVPQHTHNPWTHTRKHHQLQKLQQSDMHRNKYSILSLADDTLSFLSCNIQYNSGRDRIEFPDRKKPQHCTWAAH